MSYNADSQEEKNRASFGCTNPWVPILDTFQKKKLTFFHVPCLFLAESLDLGRIP